MLWHGAGYHQTNLSFGRDPHTLEMACHLICDLWLILIDNCLPVLIIDVFKNNSLLLANFGRASAMMYSEWIQ